MVYICRYLSSIVNDEYLELWKLYRVKKSCGIKECEESSTENLLSFCYFNISLETLNLQKMWMRIFLKSFQISAYDNKAFFAELLWMLLQQIIKGRAWKCFKHNSAFVTSFKKFQVGFFCIEWRLEIFQMLLK